MPLSLLQYNIVSYILLLPVVLNLFIWQHPLVSALFGGAFSIFQIILLGQIILQKKNLLRQLILGFLAFIIILLLLSTFVYVILNLSGSALALVYLLIPLSISLLQIKIPSFTQRSFDFHELNWQDIKLPYKTTTLLILYLTTIALSLKTLFSAQTTAAITSPWSVIDPSFWFFYFLATTILFLIAWTNKSKWLTPLLTFIHLLVSFSVALIVYKLGYGFDPFIHQATERLIDNQGAVQPKTPYYLGQYSLVVALHHLWGVSLLWIDRLLVPFLAAISLPYLWSNIFPSSSTSRTQTAWLALSILFLPFASFIVTTPQGLANLFFIWIIIASLPLLTGQPDSLPLPIMWLIALAAVATHPLTGIPALIFMTFLTLELYKNKTRLPKWLMKTFVIETFLIGSVSTALIFLLNTAISSQFTTKIKGFDSQSLNNLATWWPLSWAPTPPLFRSIFFEFGYFIVNNIWWLATITLLAIVYWLYSRSKFAIARVYLLTALVFLLNAVIVSSFLDFPEIISYEKQTYAARLFSLAAWTLLPLLGLGLVWIYKHLCKKQVFLSIIVVLAMSWLITGNLFASFPRENQYEISRQYNTSLADFHTVNRIEKQAKNKYVVLANQSVSAAAISEFGFKQYYEGPNEVAIFFYPAPTSSPLYPIFLKMVNEKPLRSTAQQAANLTDVNQIYFVVNHYWNNSPQIIEQAKLEADDWFEVDELTTVFNYQFE